MATYLIGDIHGNYSALIKILTKTKFTPGQDILWLTGDLVSRGPNSLEVLRYVKSLGKNVRIVLGNHDLNVLAMYRGFKKELHKDNITALFEAPDIDPLLTWLRCQPVLQIDEEKKLIMVHAGIIPQWNLDTAKKCAREVENVLRNEKNSDLSFLSNPMRKNIANNWIKDLKGKERLQFILNVFTRMRYCFLNGQLEFSCKEAPRNAPKIVKPWFSIPGNINQEYSIVFGHWSSLKGKNTPKNIYAIDTGCCWGGELTCLRWEDKTYFSTCC